MTRHPSGNFSAIRALRVGEGMPLKKVDGSGVPMADLSRFATRFRLAGLPRALLVRGDLSPPPALRRTSQPIAIYVRNQRHRVAMG